MRIEVRAALSNEDAGKLTVARRGPACALKCLLQGGCAALLGRAVRIPEGLKPVLLLTPLTKPSFLQMPESSCARHAYCPLPRASMRTNSITSSVSPRLLRILHLRAGAAVADSSGTIRDRRKRITEDATNEQRRMPEGARLGACSLRCRQPPLCPGALVKKGCGRCGHCGTVVAREKRGRGREERGAQAWRMTKNANGRTEVDTRC